MTIHRFPEIGPSIGQEGHIHLGSRLDHVLCKAHEFGLIESEHALQPALPQVEDHKVTRVQISPHNFQIPFKHSRQLQFEIVLIRHTDWMCL